MKFYIVIGLAVALFAIYKIQHRGSSAEGAYHNSKYGYTVNVEPDWTQEAFDSAVHKSLTPEAETINIFKAKKDPNNPGRNIMMTLFQVRHFDNSSKMNLKDLYKKSFTLVTNPNLPQLTMEESTFAGRQAILVTMPGTTKKEYFIEKDETSALLIALNVLGDDKDLSFLDEGQRMMDSFALDP